MREINLKTLFTILITTLLISGCMPDSLTKWNADPPDLIKDPVLVTPDPPTGITYQDNDMTLESGIPFSTTPSVNGTQLQFEIYECVDNTFSNCPSIATLPSGLYFNTSTGGISGTPTDLLAPSAYYKVIAFNSETNAGAEPYANIVISVYQELNGISIYILAGTKVILTVDKAGIFTDTGDITTEKRYIVSADNRGRAFIDYISESGTRLYATIQTDGYFAIDDLVDVGTTYIGHKAKITNVTIALATGAVDSFPFITYDLHEGSGIIWNANPLLNDDHFTSTTPVQDQLNPNDETRHQILLKGTNDCFGDTTCEKYIAEPMATSKYDIIISNPLLTSEEDYGVFPIEISINEEPRYVGYGHFAMILVNDASRFTIGDIVASPENQGDFNSELVEIKLGADQNPVEKYDSLYVKIKHGVPTYGIQLGNRYPQVGSGLTSIITTEDEDQFTVKAITPFSAILKTEAGPVQADVFFDGSSEGIGKIIFLVTQDTGVPLLDADPSNSPDGINKYWHAQGYMVDGIGQNLFFVSTEMSAMMDMFPVIEPSMTTIASSYFDNGFRTLQHNTFYIPSIANPLRIMNGNRNFTEATTGYLRSNLLLDLASQCIVLDDEGSELTTDTSDSAKVMRCTDTDPLITNMEFNIIQDGLGLSANINVTDTIALENPFPGLVGTGTPIIKISVDNTFYIYQNKKVSLFLHLGQGSGLEMSISPELPEGLVLDDTTGNISTLNGATLSAAPGKTDHTLTVFNALGKIEYHFSLEVVATFQVSNAVAGTDSYMLHQSGQGLHKRECSLSMAQIKKDGPHNEILCYLEAGENELNTNGVAFELAASSNLCTSVVYKPYFYHRDRYADVKREYNATFTDAGACGGAAQSGNLPPAWHQGDTGSTFGWKTSEQEICNIVLPGKLTKCGTAELSIFVTLNKTVVDVPATDTIPTTYKCETEYESMPIDCSKFGYSYRNCLGGAGAHFISENNKSDLHPFYDEVTKQYEYDSVSGSRKSFAHKSTSTLDPSNRYYSNYTVSNKCLDTTGTDEYTYYTEGWSAYPTSSDAIISYADNGGDGGIDNYELQNYLFPSSTINDPSVTEAISTSSVDENFLAISDPFKLAQPFYVFQCLDSAQEVMGTIKVIVRDWDRDFTPSDDIDKVEPGNLTTTVLEVHNIEDNFTEWDSIPTAGNNFNPYHYLAYIDTGGGLSQTCSDIQSPIPDSNPVGAASASYSFNWDYILSGDDERIIPITTATPNGLFYGFPTSLGEPDYTEGTTTIVDLE